MTSRRSLPGAPGGNGCRSRLPIRRWPIAVASAGLVPTLAGCAGSAAAVPLPAKLLKTSAAISSPSVITPRQQVVAALVDYTAALAQADKSRSTSSARRFLRPYLVASRIDGLVRAMSAIWARGQSFYGQDVLHVSSVTIAGRHAFVHDCDNTSGMGLVNTATAQTVPGSVGMSRVNLVTRLDLVSGHWLVQFQLVEDVPCTP
jgi:hypothetical protein